MDLSETRCHRGEKEGAAPEAPCLPTLRVDLPCIPAQEMGSRCCWHGKEEGMEEPEELPPTSPLGGQG